ncbi:helix-turn-helix transcriptional regulator [bacterium]|nr:helix-turn-helix transcriptional regulator [bacterium]
MKNTNFRHSKDWEKFKDTLELSREELAEIDLKVELMGKLIAIRKELGLTQSEFAQKCNIKQEYLARIEKSKTSPQIDTLLKILLPLGYKLDIVPLQ